MDCGPSTVGQKYTDTLTAVDYACVQPYGWAFVRVIGALPPVAKPPVFGKDGVIRLAFTRAPKLACKGETIDLAGYRLQCVPSGNISPPTLKVWRVRQ